MRLVERFADEVFGGLHRLLLNFMNILVDSIVTVTSALILRMVGSSSITNSIYKMEVNVIYSILKTSYSMLSVEGVRNSTKFEDREGCVVYFFVAKVGE